MEIIIGLFILSAIIFPIAIYKRRKSPRFRLIERRISEGHTSFTPQMRIDGIWLYINSYEVAYISTHKPSEFLDPHDAIALMDSYKTLGNFTIPSNRKLQYNEKEIIVE